MVEEKERNEEVDANKVDPLPESSFNNYILKKAAMGIGSMLPEREHVHIKNDMANNVKRLKALAK